MKNQSSTNVLQKVVSFYKGVPVVRLSNNDNGSFSFGLIGLAKDPGYEKSSVKDLQHEWGHNVQMVSAGLINFITFFAIPSVTNNDQSSPWELSASILGHSG